MQLKGDGLLQPSQQSDLPLSETGNRTGRPPLRKLKLKEKVKVQKDSQDNTVTALGAWYKLLLRIQNAEFYTWDSLNNIWIHITVYNLFKYWETSCYDKSAKMLIKGSKYMLYVCG